MRIWSREEFEGRKRKLQQQKKKLKDLKNGFCHLDSGVDIRRIEREIDNILLDEEVYWKQRSRADWLKEGDKNTSFFHSKASTRKNKKKIRSLEDESRKWTKNEEEVEQLFYEYFSKNFNSTKPSREQMDTALEELPAKVTEEMGNYLDQPFTEEEVAEALAQLCPTKAPGPDGSQLRFSRSIRAQ